MNLLLVEDEARVADFIQRGLKAEGWTVTVALDGESALNLTARDEFDVIILDLMLPGIGGQDVCRRLRASKNLTPVLMLTALDAVDDRVAGLRLGADDYLAKPFAFDELVARIEALVRQAGNFEAKEEEAHILRQGILCFNTRSLEISCADQHIELTTKERNILKLLLTNPDKIYSRERILNAAWGVNEDPMTNVVDVYIGRLRKKLGSAGDAIETVRGVGYKLSTHRL